MSTKALVQQEDDAQHAMPSPLSDTMLHDLPIELIEHILIKVITTEVMSLKLAKCVWKKKADPVITRLKTVCPLWNSILSTSFFRHELHRTLDSIAQVIHLEILYQTPISLDIFDAAATKDEIFMLYTPSHQDAVINVYDCNNIAEIKDVISLPGGSASRIAACNKYLYVSQEASPSVFRVTKDEEHMFKISPSPWINDQRMPGARLSASANGSLLLFSEEERETPTVISLYDANGSFQHELMLPGDEHFESAFQKSNGNIILVADGGDKCKLIEIDTSMNVVRKYKSSLRSGCCVNVADTHDRILITDTDMGNLGMELLDSEFNRLDFSQPPKYADQIVYLHVVRYNSARNEVMCLSDDGAYNDLLTVFRFNEE